MSTEDIHALIDKAKESLEVAQDIPDDKWNEFIRSVSPFPSWQAMLGKAAEEWTAKKLGL